MHKTFKCIRIEYSEMEKKIDIIRAARVLFAQFGLKKVTTDDIAKKARVSKATIYNYYKNKYDIFEEIVEIEIDRVMGAINEAVERETKAVDKLRIHLSTKIKEAGALTNFYKITRETWSEFQPYLTETQDRFMKEEKKTIQRILEVGIKNNELDIENIDFTTHVIAISLRTIEYPWALEGTTISMTALSDTLLQIITSGIRRR